MWGICLCAIAKTNGVHTTYTGGREVHVSVVMSLHSHEDHPALQTATIRPQPPIHWTYQLLSLMHCMFMHNKTTDRMHSAAS